MDGRRRGVHEDFEGGTDGAGDTDRLAGRGARAGGEDMAREWLAVGERRHAEIELSRTTIHRRAAAIKRELAATEPEGA